LTALWLEEASRRDPAHLLARPDPVAGLVQPYRLEPPLKAHRANVDAGKNIVTDRTTGVRASASRMEHAEAADHAPNQRLTSTGRAGHCSPRSKGSR
jgi:hypothetical protein